MLGRWSVILGSVLLASQALAVDDKKLSSAQNPLNPFAENFFYYDFAKNTPAGHTRSILDEYKPGHNLGFLHNLGTDWMTGISGGFRSFQFKGREEELSYFTIGHESLYILRLYHPVYLLAGPKLLYLVPSHNSKIPFTRYPDIATQVGAAAVVRLVYRITPKWILNAHVERWRGTSSDDLHGISMGAGLAVSIFGD